MPKPLGTRIASDHFDNEAAEHCRKLPIYFIVIAVLGSLQPFAQGQSTQVQACTEAIKRSNSAQEDLSKQMDLRDEQINEYLAKKRATEPDPLDYRRIVQSARDVLSICSIGLLSAETQASFLKDIGEGLVEQKQYEDAIPILRRCVATDQDYGLCWYYLGKASMALGKRFDAKTFWNKTIEIGGFDRLNADAVKMAKNDLASLELGEKYFGDQMDPDPSAPKSSESAPGKSDSPATDHSFGTGFFVSFQGHILTNNHVVAGCRTLTDRDGKPLHLVSRNAGSDLALLKADLTPAAVAIFRAGPSPRAGDSVVAFGFPLPGLLSSEGNVSSGILSATSGLQDDVRFIQISAPVQPGNSGGPLFDSAGHVIGVVVAKLDALQVARATGDVPQNVNFAVHWSEVLAFLDGESIPYRKESSQRDTSTSNIAATASQISVAIDCTK